MLNKLYLGILLTVTIPFLLGSNQEASALSFPDFTDRSTLELNGQADSLEVVGPALRVVSPFSNDATVGSVFSIEKVPIGSFSTNFEMSFDDGALGDGMTFVIQNDPRGAMAIGGIGGDNGYDDGGNLPPHPHPIVSSVAVNFDLFANGGLDTAEGISIVKDGDIFTELEPTFPFDFTDTIHYFVWIDYDGTTLEVYISTTNVKPNNPVQSHEIDIPQTVQADGGTAHVGFTAANFFGGSSAWLYNWNFDANMGILTCGTGTHLNENTNQCDPDVTQAQLDDALAEADGILQTLFEFLRVFGVI